MTDIREWLGIDLNLQPKTFRFNLQYFAAEDEGRTEEPTEHKKKKAREEGNVPKSQELVGIIVFLLTFWTVAALSNTIFQGLVDIFQFNLNAILDHEPDTFDLYPNLMRLLWMIVKVVVPVMAVGVIGALIANVAQTGFIFSTKKLSPDFEKLFSNIGSNFKKMFWSTETIFNLFKSLLKVVGVFAIAFLVANARAGEIISIPRIPVINAMSLIANIILQYVTFTGILLLVFAIGDYAFQRWQYRESLKMSKFEVKQEYKEMEGDPLIKNRIREMERRLLNNKMMKEVPTADVVITNPTHFAIALKYKPEFMNAPMIVAKGKDDIARRIKEVAKDNGVYVIENKPLARALYYRTEVGDYIPEDLYVAVANILKTVYNMKSSVMPDNVA